MRNLPYGRFFTYRVIYYINESSANKNLGGPK